MQLKFLLWAFVATTVIASAVPEVAEKRHYGAPSTVTKYVTKWTTKCVPKTKTCTKWSKTRTITNTKCSKTTTRWKTKTSTRWKTTTKPASTKTTTETEIKFSTTTATSTATETTVSTTTITQSPSSAPTGARYAGCYKENLENGHMLSDLSTSTDVTPDTCQKRCFDAGYALAGLTNGTTCACGHSIENPWAEVGDEVNDCSTQCVADPEEFCGGINFFEIYVQSKNPTNIGCYDDSTSNAILSEAFYTSPKMTQSLCQDLCYGQEFTLAGLKNGNECVCGDQFISAPIQDGKGQCTKACAGNENEHCGGEFFLEVFAFTG
ncbi:uncharacterized protein DFL_005886 [Arthrobotrys flagrans]|uniref:WSC domain-containing protein n=1 Tax=Arthrobotrys flagrans TaxID=97331 RepID=A0A436ZZ49_ARTFL|nr:hypothetical protein DFL_005886 [Arthrobotrys flagrans]